jgi:signal transduction histidine kinase
MVSLIEDAGQGFEPNKLGVRLGNQAMRERVELLDGQLRIESRQRAGATVSVQVPVR